jgi:hypothetical protein
MGKGLKFNPDDIIQLAVQNPGFGFRKFVKLLCGETSRQPSSKAQSQVIRIFEIHELETGVNLYELLQDTSNHNIVSLPDYLRITNSKYPPSGYGQGNGGRTPKPQRKGVKSRNIKIPLPPQIFNWGSIDKNGSRFVVEGRGKTNHWKIIDIKKFMIHYEVEMKTIGQISEIMNLSKAWIINLINKIEIYDGEGILHDWINVVDSIYRVEQNRGKNHFEDELMAEFRGIFRDYIENPLETETPTTDDIFWIYSQLLLEEE